MRFTLSFYSPPNPHPVYLICSPLININPNIVTIICVHGNVSSKLHRVLHLSPWILANEEFRVKTQIQTKVYLESHRGRSELCRKWASWAAWPQETNYRGKRRALGAEEKGKENTPLGKREGERCKQGKKERKGVVCSRGREPHWVLHLKGFIWRSQGRISIEYSSAFQECLLRAVVSTD